MRAVLTMLIVAAIGAGAAPLPVAVQPPSQSRETDSPPAMTLNYLHDRLSACAEATVASPGWTQAVLSGLSPTSVRVPPEGLLSLVRNDLPVAAIILIHDDQLFCHTRNGVRTWPVPATPEAIRALAGEVGQTLGLSADAQRQLQEPQLADRQLFVARYGLPAYRVPGQLSTPAAVVTFLGPIRRAYPENAEIAAQLLRAAAQVLAERRPAADDVKTVQALVPLALPTVLGTAHEGAAAALFASNSDRFLNDLVALAAAPVAGEVSLDNLLDDAPGGSGKRDAVPMKQKIGALRLLAKVNPKLAEPLLAKARQSEIAELKQAVAAFSQPPAAPPPTTPNLEAVQVDAVLAALAAGVGPDQQATAVRLANSAYPPVALAARQALAVLRPEAPLDAARFDLEIAHPYTRRQLLDRHRDQPDFLLAACRNPDPPTRALALARLAKADPAAAKSAVAEALNDPYLWVRLHAASLSQQAVVRPATAILQAALDAETDPAVRQLLRQALGIAGDLPAAARSVAERPNLRWLCGYGADAVTSPFDAYYLFEPRLTPLWQDAHAAGKIFFSRLSPIGNPGSVVTDTRARDAFWLNLLAQLPSETLPYLDGVVYGEETMRLAAEDLWDSGWQLFCLDAGLDPGRVAGNPEALTSIERDAWLYWARERGVEGFNELYRFTKLYFGALRPGIQVATFLPKELLLKDGTYPPDRQMQFDVGGIYDYKGCNRLAGYWLVRRYKTLWPDRPVLWLSLGIGGYEMNPVMHTHQPPTAPLATRQARAYADTISAWLAGAQAGWFSVWIFVLPTHQSGMPMSGVVVNLEDAGNVPLLQRGADLAYRGVVDLRLTKEAAKNAPTLGEAAGDGDAAFTLDDKPDPRQMEAAKIAVEQQALIAGMQLYQKYVYDCVRVFGDLPERPTPLPVLLVRDGISVWSRDGELPLIPGFGLFQSGDFVCEINHLASMELSRYRVIAIHDPAQLRDETIAALTAWLRDTEGTLYIHGDLTADNTREMPTPRDLDGRLERDWPWEGSLTIRPQAPAEATTADLGKVSIVATIDGGESLLAIDGQTVLARWRSPDFKGTVIVDGLSRTGPAYLDLLAPHLAPGGPPWFLQMGETGGLTLVAGSRYYSDARRPYPLPDGIDLLTGDQAPTIGVNSDGAILATDFQGRRAIVHNGIAILAEQPFTQVERLPDGLRLHGGGLVRVQIHNGTLRPLDLPEAEAPLTFLLSTEPGQTTLEGRLYFRSPKPVNLIRQP